MDVSGTLSYYLDYDLNGEPTEGLFEPYEAVLYVATVEQKQAWDDFLIATRKKLYAPRDVFPPDMARLTP